MNSSFNKLTPTDMKISFNRIGHSGYWLRFFLFPVLALVLFASCKNSSSSEKKELIIFHAGSMTVPLKKMIEVYQKENPGCKILTEAAGSRDCARKIIDLKKTCDIMVSADYQVINQMLVSEHAKWNLHFATNEMVIAFSPKAKYSTEINAQNWHEIMLRPNVIFGRSDPNADPCGYRTAIIFKLAEKFYKKSGLSSKLLSKDKKFIRPKEVDLLGLLESNAMDYIFIYKSVALQHNLKFLNLPDSINLKNTEMRDFYSSVSVEVTGKKPGEIQVITGEPMVYSLTIPVTTGNPKLAEDFVAFFINKNKGLKILKETYQQPLSKLVVENISGMPSKLKEEINKTNLP